jgi:5-methylcytosine-specific restriction protein A
VKTCAEPGCPELIPKGTTRCPKHSRAKDQAIQRRMSEQRRVYFTPRWRGLRRSILRDQPWCAVEGCKRTATEVDHIVPLRGGGAQYDRANLQGLCVQHHASKTATEVWHA